MIELVVTVLFLIVLEGLLSFDNALALAAMVRHLPVSQQKKALHYGMLGAFSFRALILFFIVYVVGNVWFKALGAAYLLYLSISFFCKKEDEGATTKNAVRTFWRTIVMVELMDLAFSVDSIVAAAGVSSRYEVLLAGGILGIIMMRYAATIFIGLMAKFPDLERSAFLLVGIVGAKLALEAWPGVDFHDKAQPWFWCVWGLMALSLTSGLRRRRVLIRA